MTTRVDREGIARTYALIRPHVRRTPVIEVDSKDFGMDCGMLPMKIERMKR